MKQYIDAFFALGPMSYVIIGIFILSFVVAIVSYKMNKKSKEDWLNEHVDAVRISLATEGMNIITQKSLYARVVEGEARIFMETEGYVIYSVPGNIKVEVTYSYTRPGVMYKTVTKTWGPQVLDLEIKAGKEYRLTFDKKEEKFDLIEK